MNLSESYRRRLKELAGIKEGDRMSSIDINSYYDKHADNKEWIQILSRFPETLQREIIDERPEGSKEDIEEIGGWNISGNKPVAVPLSQLLKSKENFSSISRTPQDVIDHINKLWGLDVKQTGVYDQNPGRYFEYAKMPSETAKPSIMVNGDIYWGVGRFISALIRGDKSITVWDIRDN